MKPRLLTVGYSQHPWEDFLALLRRHRVDALADVRSGPYSRHRPEFNRELLHRRLGDAGVRYVFLGRELGARREEPQCFVGDRVCYLRTAAAPLFQAGLRRLRDGATRHRITLMCAEEDPLPCHRTALVGRALRDEFDLRHIRGDGTLESHAATERRMMDAVGVGPADLFADADELLAEAYRRQGERVSWVRPPT